MTWFRGRRVDRCESCGGEFGETTGEVDGRLVCSLCVEAANARSWDWLVVLMGAISREEASGEP